MMQASFDKVINNDLGKTLLIVIVMVIMSKIVAWVSGDLHYLYIAAAAIAAFVYLGRDGTNSLGSGAYIGIAMLPMGYIEISVGLLISVLLMVFSLFIIRAVEKENKFVSFLVAVVLAFALAYLSHSILDALPENLQLDNWRRGY